MKVAFKMPKMGESITEATIITWLKSVGDTVAAEETIVEVATDKVDNDVPSPVSGVITEIRFGKDDVVKVGEVMAFIEVVEGAGNKVQGIEPAIDIKIESKQTLNPEPKTLNL